MARLKLSQHNSLNGSHVPANYLGGRISAFNGLYVPSRSAQINGTHEVDWLDVTSELIQQAFNAPNITVYKDDADTALQFSVKAFSCWLGGVLCTYAGGNAIAGLSAGSTRYIWADLSNAPTVTIGVGAAWPTTVPHLRIAAIAAPASGHWLPANLTYYVADQAVRPVSGLILPVVVPFVYNTASPAALMTVPNGCMVKEAAVIIDTNYNGSGYSLSIGDSGNNARLLATAAVNAGAAGAYRANPFYKYTAQTTINLYNTTGTASAGAGRAYLELVL